MCRDGRGRGGCRLNVPLTVERLGTMARHLISVDYRRAWLLATATRSDCVSRPSGVTGSSAYVTTPRDSDVSQSRQVIYCSKLIDGVLGVIGIYRDVSPGDLPSNEP